MKSTYTKELLKSVFDTISGFPDLENEEYYCCSIVGNKWLSSFKRVHSIDELIDEHILKGARIVILTNGKRFEAFEAPGWERTIAGNVSTGKSYCIVDIVHDLIEQRNNPDGIGGTLDKIYLKNTEQQFCESARLDESPRVGLFWVDTKGRTPKVYGVGVPIRDGEMFGRGTKDQHVVHPSSHYESWNEVKKANPHWKNIRDYEDVPRGRTVFKYERDNNHFVVYMSPLLNDAKCIEAVKQYFDLPSNTVFDFSDDHYQPVSY